MSNQGTANPAAIAKAVPPTLALSACQNCPRTTRAQAVVMPHDGHGLPITARNVHGGNPNCSCVPRPSGLGRSHSARVSSAISVAPPAARISRAEFVSFAGANGLVLVTSLAGKERENSETRKSRQERFITVEFRVAEVVRLRSCDLVRVQLLQNSDLKSTSHSLLQPMSDLRFEPTAAPRPD